MQINRDNHDPVPIPKGVQIEEWGGDFTIRRRWASVNSVGGSAIVCLLLNGFIGYIWYSLSDQGMPNIFKIVLLPFMAVGLGMTYYCLACLLNSTQLCVSNNCLTVRHGPLPWISFANRAPWISFANRAVPTSEIQQLRCTSKWHSQTGSSIGRTTYQLHALQSNSPPVKLLAGLDEDQHDQVIFIKQEIEKHLGIEDRRGRQDSLT